MNSAPATVFLLAHQDDELGCLPEIETAASAGGRRAVCVFLTNGAQRWADPKRRNAESSRGLASIGVAAADILCLGTDYGIPDGSLAECLAEVDAALREVLARVGPIGCIVTHAWEGGHQDHDAAHLLGVGAALRLGVLGASRQFPLYRASGGALPYVAFAPLPENGAVDNRPFPYERGLRYLLLARRYVSQWRAIAGLFPFLTYHYTIRRRQQLQPLSMARLAERPHPGPLLFERRGRATYARLRSKADAYLASLHEATPHGRRAP